MSKLETKPQKEFYNYGSFINYKAFKDFHLINKIDDHYFKPGHCMLLAFIVERFYRYDDMPHIVNNGQRFILINNSYISQNLIFLRVKSRQIANYIRDLREHGIIKTINIDNNHRYVNVNYKLIELCYNYNFTFTPTNYLQKNKPELWEWFINEWKPYFESTEDFKKFVENFDNSRQIKNYSYNTVTIYDHLINAVRKKVYSK